MLKDKFLYGFCWGLLPLLVFGLLMWLNVSIVEKSVISSGFLGFKDSTVALVAICSNLIPTFFADKAKMDEFVRGIMIPTVLLALTWFVYFNPLGL